MDLYWDREFEWKSYKGNKKIKDMEDTHIINVVHYLKKRLEKIAKQLPDWKDTHTANALFNFTQEMKFRKIPESSLDNAPYEFEDDKGNLRKWDYESNSFIVTPPSLRFIKDD